MGGSSSSKAEWLGVLETAAKLSVEQSSAVWVWIMQELRLGPQYFLAIREAVQQGRWRTAKNPKAYIKTAAKRQALKMGLVKEDSGNLVTVGSRRSEGEEISGEEALDLEARPSVRPDWNKWAAAAGLDEWEMKVLGYRLIGVGRERALAIQTDEESRKALQAAWKRFGRNGMERLRAAAKINIEKNVPESGFFDTSK